MAGTLPKMAEGPFYPSAAWRARSSGWHASLTAAQRSGQRLEARGKHQGLGLRVVAD